MSLKPWWNIMTDSLKYGKVKVKSSNIKLFKWETLPDREAPSVKMYNSRQISRGVPEKPLLPWQGLCPWGPGPLLCRHCPPCPGGWGATILGHQWAISLSLNWIFLQSSVLVIQLIFYVHLLCAKGIPCGSAGKESSCNVGDLGSISR